MKLEIKHLAPYLPYQLQCKFTGRDRFFIKNGDIVQLLASDIERLSKDAEFKPILRPLSDMTKEIKVGGEIFIPYDKLKTVVSDEQWIKICNTVDRKEYNKVVDMPYWYVNELIKWHFDIFGLIVNDLAIDINTL